MGQMNRSTSIEREHAFPSSTPPNTPLAVSPYAGVVQDCLFLGLVALLSLILYVRDLGFYSDDWDFLGRMGLSPDQSLTGLFRAFYVPDEGVWMRPVQGLYLTSLYWLFGLHPLGYHLVNAAMLVAVGIVFHLVLCALKQPRLLSVAAPTLYVLLPHYSTDRFWGAAFQANLCMAFYFLSLFADLQAVESRGDQLWAWKALSVLCLLLSSLAYEIVLPLFLLNPLLVWYYSTMIDRSVLRSRLRRPMVAMLLVMNPLALSLVMIFKAMITTRPGVGLVSLGDIVWLARQAIGVNFVFYGLGLPRIMWRIRRDYPDIRIFALGLALSIAIFGYLYRITVRSSSAMPGRMNLLRFIAGGLVIFGLGYAIFLANKHVVFTPTGISNRIAIAAAVGVVLCLVGGVGWVATLLPSHRLQRLFCCALLALLSTTSFLITNTLASFWVAANRRQQQVLANIREQFPALESGRSLILDGICSHVGPAIVFDSSWDLQGALRLLYHDETLRANIVTPRMTVREDGLYTELDGVKYRYPYGELLIYHAGRKMIYPLPNAEAARLYFQTLNPDRSNGCPYGGHEHGAPVF